MPAGRDVSRLPARESSIAQVTTERNDGARPLEGKAEADPLGGFRLVNLSTRKG
jgi:hypothetical protein